jgi:hypothetical protein
MTPLPSLRKLLAEATAAGARTWSYNYMDKPRPCYRLQDGSDDGDIAEAWDAPVASLLVAAVNALPALLDVAERAQRLVDAMFRESNPDVVEARLDLAAAIRALEAEEER